MLRAFPEALLYTSVYEPRLTFPEFGRYDVRTTGLQRVTLFREDPRKALPLLAAAFSGLRVEDVDVVICSSSGWAHGVSTGSPKLVYCYNPPRWLWQREDYVAAQPRPVQLAFRLMSPYLRRWDQRAARQARQYLTSSTTVQNRIRRIYGIEAELLPPPVTIDPAAARHPVGGVESGFFLVVSRARGYKNVEHVCLAFERMPDQRLVVAGELPGRPGGGPWSENISGVARLSDPELRWLYANCRAVLSTAHEDFGLTPLEGNAFGRPALVLRAGGFLDTIVEGVTGFYLEDGQPESVVAAVECLLKNPLDSDPIVEHARLYDEAVFAESLRRHVHRLAAARPAFVTGQ